MNRIIRPLLAGLLLCLCVTDLRAQRKKKEFAVTTGFATKISDPFFPEPSHGFHMGINMYDRDATKFSSDAQFSMNYTFDKSGSTKRFTLNALYGARMYFTVPEKNTRFFVSLLTGFAFRNESGDDFVENLPDIGYSGGFYVESGRCVFGVAVESPTNATFKIGLTL